MGSRTLTKGEKNYLIFEIEAQSIIFALNRCSFYIRGAEHFVVRSDHKALCGIESRAFSEVTNTRVLKLMEMCSVYSFSVEHIQGKLNVVADCLSRMPLWTGVEESDREPDMVRAVRSIISREDAGLEEMKTVAGEDEEYKLLLEAFISRKPLKDLSENHPARLYTSIWDRVSVMDAVTDQPLLVVDNQRIIVPTKLRQTIVDDLHSKTHRGAEQMKLTLRSLYFWPTQKAMVDKTCKDCIACLENKDSQPMEPFLKPDVDITELDPMEDIAADLFYTSGKAHLCVADRFSGYLFWRQLANETTAEVVKAMETIFTEHSFPRLLRSDGGPCFRGRFSEEMAKLGIKHKRGGATNHQSQGLVERGIKSLKKLYLKLDPSVRGPVKLQYAVMTLNSMVRADGSGSAAQMFFGRTPRTGKFGIIPPGKVSRDDLAEARSKTHRAMRERTKDNRKVGKFQKNDRVLLQDEQTGKFKHRATVIEPRDKRSEDPRSYYMRKDTSGEVLLRNRRHFKKLPDSPVEAAPAPASPVEAPAELAVRAEPRTRSEHARAEVGSLQPETAELALHVQQVTARHEELAESSEKHGHCQPGVLTLAGDVGQYRPLDAIASMQCSSRRSTKWSD